MVGWGKEMANYFLHPVMQQTALQMVPPFLIGKRMTCGFTCAISIITPPQRILWPGFSYRDYLHGAFAMSFTSLPLTEINHKLPAQRIESQWITLQLTLFCTRAAS